MSLVRVAQQTAVLAYKHYLENLEKIANLKYLKHKCE
jgi:hypothetical protein